MDTLKDKEVLEDLVEQGRMPWRISDAPTVAPHLDRKAGRGGLRLKGPNQRLG